MQLDPDVLELGRRVVIDWSWQLRAQTWVFLPSGNPRTSTGHDSLRCSPGSASAASEQGATKLSGPNKYWFRSAKARIAAGRSANSARVLLRALNDRSLGGREAKPRRMDAPGRARPLVKPARRLPASAAVARRSSILRYRLCSWQEDDEMTGKNQQLPTAVHSPNNPTPPLQHVINQLDQQLHLEADCASSAKP